jgi:hypothetical protein
MILVTAPIQAARGEQLMTEAERMNLWWKLADKSGITGEANYCENCGKVLYHYMDLGAPSGVDGATCHECNDEEKN